MVFAQFSDNHLARVNACTLSCAISLLPLLSLSVDDIFLSGNLDYFANLLPCVAPSHNLNFILSDGHEWSMVLLPQLFGKRRRHNHPANVGSALTCLLRFLPQSEITKGLNFILAAGTSVIFLYFLYCTVGIIEKAMGEMYILVRSMFFKYIYIYKFPLIPGDVGPMGSCPIHLSVRKN